MAMIDKRTFTLVKETHFENSPFHIKYYGGYLALSFSSGQLWYMNPEELTTEKVFYKILIVFAGDGFMFYNI